MNVLFLSPGFPAEMPYFTRGLAQVGAQVIGLGDMDEGALPQMARENLAAYFKTNWADEDAILGTIRDIASRVRIDRVECLWELLMIPAAKAREMLDLPGMRVHETVPFRDKEEMKRVLDANGIRTPHHYRCHTTQECRQAAERIGYPIIVKPISGAGSTDTYRVDNDAELDAVLPRVRHVPQVSVEEFIEAEEFTFDTICHEGEVLFYNICWYRPRPLVSKKLEWVSQQTFALKEPEVDYLQSGREMGHAVLKAMNFRTGFTHMEWHRRHDGTAVFGEIAARPVGAQTLHVMNYSTDMDLFAAWAEVAMHGRLSQPVTRNYNACSIFKRAQGQGRIQRIEGLTKLMSEYGEHIVAVDLLPLGAHRRDWQATLISDGMVILRHPSLQTCIEIADKVGTDLQLYAG